MIDYLATDCKEFYMDVLQAWPARVAYGHEMPAMMYWLREASRELREAKERKHVHIAASGNVDQSTVSRFESGDSTPRDIDGLIAAYADDLDLDPREIWAMALRAWDAATQPEGDGAIPGPPGGFPHRPGDPSTTDGTPEQQVSRVARGARRRKVA
jgi:hypothetical protein